MLLSVGLLPCISAAPVLAGQWIPGWVHVHSTYSDGACTPAEWAFQARLMGLKFVVFTDHYDMIPNPLKWTTPVSAVFHGILPNLVLSGRRPWGFGSYHEAVTSLNAPGVFAAIPGAEIGAKWSPSPGQEASSHTLALGEISELDSQVRDEYCEKSGKQQDVINKILQWGMVPVAAHPTFFKPDCDYRYNFRAEERRGLKGVEFWNIYTEAQGQLCLAFYLQLVREQGSATVTSGPDLHFLPAQLEAASRVTFANVDQVTSEELLRAFCEGRTVATQYGVKSFGLWPAPGQHITTDRPKFSLSLEFDHEPGPKQLLIYRDGDPTPVGTLDSKPLGEKGCYFEEWTDQGAAPGEHTYVLWVREVFVCSPVFVNVTPSPPQGKKWPFDPILVIDRSGSIQSVDGLMQEIEKDAKTFVDKLLQRARYVAVVNFSGRGEARLDCAFSNNRDQVLRAIVSPSLGGGATALYDAVDVALNSAPAGGKTALIVFSDGCENSSVRSLRDVLRNAQTRGVPVLTVGYKGSEALPRNEEVLRALADATGGFYERAENLDVERMLSRFSSYLEYKEQTGPQGPAW